jgi:hypothetical protein
VKKIPPHPIRSAVFDPELRPKGAHDEALPLSFDPEALDGEGGGEGGGDFRSGRKKWFLFLFYHWKGKTRKDSNKE